MTLLRACAIHDNGLSFNDLRRKSDDLVPATLSRLLKGLVAEDLLAHDPDTGRYRIGPAVGELCELAFGSDRRKTLIDRHLRELSSTTGQSALFEQAVGDPEAMQMRHESYVIAEGTVGYSKIGEPMFVLSQGFGLGIMVQYETDDRERIIAEHVKRTGESARTIREELATLARDGVLARPETYRSNNQGVTRIVAPVNASPFPPSSIGLTVFGREGNALNSNQIDQWNRAVKRTAGALSADLAGMGRHGVSALGQDMYSQGADQ